MKTTSIILVFAALIASSYAAVCINKISQGTCAYMSKDDKNFCDGVYGKFCMRFCKKCKPPTGGSGKPTICGVSKAPPGRVVNGVKAKVGAWPWIASLSLFSSHFCGATLISEKWVLTAAHCLLAGHPASSLYINLGVNDQAKTMNETTYQRIPVKRIIEHPDWSYNVGVTEAKDVLSDIALLELEFPAVMSNRVGIACLPKKGAYPKVGTQCTVAGWGLTAYPSNNATRNLQQTRLPIVGTPHIGCHNNPEVVCAGLGFDKQPDGKQHPNMCSGDSGGPLVCQKADGRWQLEGVASYVHTYCKFYSGFAPVNKYIDWIKKYVK